VGKSLWLTSFEARIREAVAVNGVEVLALVCPKDEVIDPKGFLNL
jgi:hypothetical protein